jgi:hypothetical protein
MEFSRVRRGSIATIAFVALALAACGGDDDDDAADEASLTTTEQTAEQSATNGAADTITEACADLMGQYLEQLEPLVKDIDWESADAGQLDQLQSQMGTDFDSLDDEITSKCADYIFTTSESNLQQAIEIAKERAPGTVAWLTFVEKVTRTPSSATTSDGTDAAASDLPTDCAGAQAYIENQMAEHATIMELPGSELTALSQVISVASQQCPPADTFFSRDDVTKFLGG